MWHRGKQSVALDLERADDRDDRLSPSDRTADVVVHTFSPATAERLGLADDALRAEHPRLIVVLDHRVRHRGRRARARRVRRARAGALGMQYEQPGLREGPIFLHSPLPSFGAALLADVGISAALRAREITGVGQLVETSLMQGALVWMTQLWRHATSPTPRSTRCGSSRISCRRRASRRATGVGSTR